MAQKQLPYGYKWFNGVVLSNRQTDDYNILSDEIQRAEDFYADPFHAHIEKLKDQRHRSLTICFDVQRNINPYKGLSVKAHD